MDAFSVKTIRMSEVSRWLKPTSWLPDQAEDAEALENIPSKKYLSSLAVDMSAGGKGTRGGYNSAGYRVFTVSESGASVAATARLTWPMPSRLSSWVTRSVSLCKQRLLISTVVRS